MSVNRRGVAMMASAHLVDDLYQGAVPALLPFLVAERHYSYAAVAGLTLAATVLSSVAQPFFGWWTDRRPRRWMIPAGLGLAAVGFGLSGIFSSYAVTWITVALSGLGIAAFHPEGARAARQASGDSNRGMSIFAFGGNLGFAMGSLIATPVLLATGLRGTALLLIPAAVMVLVLVRWLDGVLDGRKGRPREPLPMPSGRDDWPAFLRLTAIVMVRSVMFYGLVSFVALYFIHELGASVALGGAMLTLFLLSGTMGTVLGGWLADRFGRMAGIRAGFALCIPTLCGLVLMPQWQFALVFVILLGIAMYLPYSVFIVLGQDYLPNRIGTASGVTVGLSVSAGGLFNPLLGLLADGAGLRLALAVLLVLPAVALLLSLAMRDPGRTAPGDEVSGLELG